MEVLSFDEAYEEAKTLTSGKPHLLLGNGFSIACEPTIFSYNALIESADLKTLSNSCTKVFEHLKTNDFEKIMKVLHLTNTINDYYDNISSKSEEMLSDVKKLKDILIETITTKHPADPTTIGATRLENSLTFLKRFNKIFTVNYDLLLYWATMQERPPYGDDGFRDYSGAGFVHWHFLNATRQKVFYLHGALHIYDENDLIKKYAFSRTGLKLLDFIEFQLRTNNFPLIVAEGTSSQKINKINHNPYLQHCYEKLCMLNSPLFVYGHSLSSNDDHLYKNLNSVNHIYIGLFGDPESDVNRSIVEQVQHYQYTFWSRRRKIVKYFDSSTVTLW